MLCFQSFLNLGVSGLCIQLRNVFTSVSNTFSASSAGLHHSRCPGYCSFSRNATHSVVYNQLRAASAVVTQDDIYRYGHCSVARCVTSFHCEHKKRFGSRERLKACRNTSLSDEKGLEKLRRVDKDMHIRVCRRLC